MESDHSATPVGVKLLHVCEIVKQVVGQLAPDVNEHAAGALHMSTCVTRVCADAGIVTYAWSHLWIVLNAALEASMLDAAAAYEDAASGGDAVWDNMLAWHAEMLREEVRAVIFLALNPGKFVEEIREELRTNTLVRRLRHCRDNEGKVFVCMYQTLLRQRVRDADYSVDDTDGQGDDWDHVRMAKATTKLFKACMSAQVVGTAKTAVPPGFKAFMQEACSEKGPLMCGCKKCVQTSNCEVRNALLVQALCAMPRGRVRKAGLREILDEVERLEVNCKEWQIRGLRLGMSAGAGNAQGAPNACAVTPVNEWKLLIARCEQLESAARTSASQELLECRALLLAERAKAKGDELIMEEELEKLRAANAEMLAELKKTKTTRRTTQVLNELKRDNEQLRAANAEMLAELKNNNPPRSATQVLNALKRDNEQLRAANAEMLAELKNNNPPPSSTQVLNALKRDNEQLRAANAEMLAELKNNNPPRSATQVLNAIKRDNEQLRAANAEMLAELKNNNPPRSATHKVPDARGRENPPRALQAHEN